jgi:hypothetical protein
VLLLGLLGALGCDSSRGARFEDSELLLGLGGTYKLDLTDEGPASDYTVVVRGGSVTASLDTEYEFSTRRVIVWVEAIAEGVSEVQLRRRGRVLDTLSVEVAAVAEVHGELMLDFTTVLLQEPFALIAGESAILRLAGEDARGRSFDRFYRELDEVDPGVALTQVWRNTYSLEAVAAGESMVTVEVDNGRLLDTTIHVLQPEDITAIHVALLGDRSVMAVGTDGEGRQVQLQDVQLEVDGVSLPMFGLGLSAVDEDTPAGTVLTASWLGHTATHTF